MFGALVRLLYFVADKIFSVWCETIISNTDDFWWKNEFPFLLQ